jgi:hypothetical protein
MKSNEQIGVIAAQRLRTWTAPSGAAYIELQLLVTTAPHQEPTPLPWVRMSPEQAAELVHQLSLTTAAAQGVIEPPGGPMQ